MFCPLISLLIDGVMKCCCWVALLDDSIILKRSCPLFFGYHFLLEHFLLLGCQAIKRSSIEDESSRKMHGSLDV